MEESRKYVNELTGCFFIPRYQRGYRWEHRQVSQLVKDLYEAAQKDIHTNESKGYCLQPLIVSKSVDDAETEKAEVVAVIDGQQRLTTIRLLLEALGARPDWELTYAKGVRTKIDDWYIEKANECLKAKVEKLGKPQKQKLLSFINEKTYFLWHETQEDEHEVFRRINSGKIPLSNAELIKARVLSYGTESEKQLRAALWDQIEQRLQDDDFWYFANPEAKISQFSATRIDFLFALYAEEKEYTSWRFAPSAIYNLIRGENNSETEIDAHFKDAWKSVTQYFYRLEEWFRDTPLYHRVGFLVNCKTRGVDKVKDVLKLLQSAKTWEKSSVLEHLNNQCIKAVVGERSFKQITSSVKFYEYLLKYLEGLEYGENSSEINNILLLFNIAQTEEMGLRCVTDIPGKQVYFEQIRFPFGFYGATDWSLEHIHAQKAEGKNGSNRIGNLALLPGKFNTEFGKRNFASKREFLKQWAEGKSPCEGFIPLGTRQVFCRILGRPNVKDEWDEFLDQPEGEDGKLYRTEISQVIANYLKRD